MSAALNNSPDLQLILNSITPQEAARFIALCSVYANQRILDSELYFNLAFAAASERVQRICPDDHGLWNKLIAAKQVVEVWHKGKSGQ